MEPKSASGAPWEGEISLGNSPGAPPEVHHEFFSAPEASGSDLGAPREGKIRIPCCGPCLREALEAIASREAFTDGRRMLTLSKL